MIFQSITSASLPFILSSILFLLLIIRYLRPKHGNSKKFKLPPGPRKLPIIGNLHQLVGSKLPHQRLTELAKQHGPVMHLQLGELSAMIISTPETAKDVFKTYDLIFANRPSFATIDLLSFGNSSLLFASHGVYWRQMRKIIALELLSVTRVLGFRSIREEEMKNIVNEISSTQGSIINLSSKVIGYTNCVTCKATVFRQGSIIKHNQQEELVQLLRIFGKLLSALNLADLYPSLKILRHLSGMVGRVADFNGKMNNIFDSIISTHKRKRRDKRMDINNEDDSSISGHVEDLVDVLLRIQVESKDNIGFRITTNNIKGVINDILNTGTGTSSTTTNWAMAEMLRNPNVMNKAQAEVREALQGKDHVEESGIEGLKYLKLVIKETLRLHPPTTMLPRRPTENCKINGYDVPSTSRIFVNLWAIGRDPRYWRDPEKFEPERFLESSIGFSGTHFQFLPFGGGRRICPGITFASKTIELILATLLYHFDWKLPDGQNPQELDMSETFGIATQRRKNLYVMATKVH